MIKAKPFIKWVGGKTQLIQDIVAHLPADFAHFDTYIEPFVGGGAFLFYVLSTYPSIKQVVINDINSKLIMLYRTIKERPAELICRLKELSDAFLPLNEDERKAYYLSIRESFNHSVQDDTLSQSALFIFLNRTCFNGLYRENSKGFFNVPFGRYTRPMICDVDNLMAVSRLLQKVTLLSGDFEQTFQYIKGKTLFYFDPPYKPLSATSSFNSYSKVSFDDLEQTRLARFCQRIDTCGHHFILSNSDVKGKDPTDDFFDRLYEQFDMQRVFAVRNVNANGEKRGKLTELMISNSSRFSCN